jgi:putative hydrolase of the HAD superfamily
MERYNAISFDLWLTLLKSNPSFKAKRDEMVFKEFNPTNKSLDWIKSSIRSSDLYATTMSEKSGLHIPAKTIWARIFSQMSTPIALSMLERVDNKTQELFKKYPPLPYDNDTIPTLQKLVKRYQLYVVSNTGFIKGSTVMEAMPVEISELITAWNFSDELHFSKPHPELFFKKVDLHVGDNPIADAGCEKLGIGFFQINSNNKTLKTYYERQFFFAQNYK